MKAIRVREFGEPSVLRHEDVPEPQPGPGQVLVRVRAAGVNPVESYIRRGIYGPKPFPYTPGSDAAGIVEAAGADVKRVKQGDRVYTSGSISGSYAELALCAENQVHRLPEKLSFAQGAAIGVPYATACRALFDRGSARPGDAVLVHGASGGVGVASVQLARAAGMNVIGTASTDRGKQLVLNEGAHHVLDHSREGYLQELMKLTNDRGVDVILEMLANVNLGKDLTVLAQRGRVVVIGSRGDVQINPRETMRRESEIRGMMLAGATPDEVLRIHAALIAGFENGTLRPIVGREYPLAEAAAAHVEIIEGKSYGKIVLVPE